MVGSTAGKRAERGTPSPAPALRERPGSETTRGRTDFDTRCRFIERRRVTVRVSRSRIAPVILANGIDAGYGRGLAPGNLKGGQRGRGFAPSCEPAVGALGEEGSLCGDGLRDLPVARWRRASALRAADEARWCPSPFARP